MNAIQVEMQGTLQPDGTLVLDKKPDLPGGRVNVILQMITPILPPPNALAVLDAIRAERQALGLTPRSGEEIAAEINAMRDEWEEHQLALERIQEEAQRSREKPPC
jgi:hypothetical protein